MLAMSSYPMRVSFCVVYVRIAFSKERLEEERRRLAEEEAQLLSDYCLQQIHYRGVTSLSFSRRKWGDIVSAWNTGCKVFKKMRKKCKRRKYHIMKEKDYIHLLYSALKCLKEVELEPVRWWVLPVGRLHENKQEELHKRCCCRDRIFGEFACLCW